MNSMLTKLRETFRSREVMTPEQYAEKMLRRGLNNDGTPILDPLPIAPPVGYKKAPSMVEIVRDMVRSERLADAARQSGHETFEESEDFDVGDEDPLARSPWENDFDPPLEELLKAGRAALEEKKKVEQAEPKADAGGSGAKPPRKPPAPPAPEAVPEP